VRRLVWLTLLAGAACSEISAVDAGPTSSFYRPTGMGVVAGKLVVASSNGDLLYDTSTGGSVISVDPAIDRGDGKAGLVDGFNIQSFAGEMAIADPAACPDMVAQFPQPLGILPVRGENLVYLLQVDGGGGVHCDGCDLVIGGTEHVDPYFAGIACGNGIARAFVAYLRSSTGAAWISQLDLTKPVSDPAFLQSSPYGTGNIRAFAYDAALRRVYFAVSGLGIGAELLWVDLGGGCLLGDPTAGACPTGFAQLPAGLEATGVALSTPDVAFAHRRAYVIARVVDSAISTTTTTDGVLLVADLVDDVTGITRLQIVDQIPVGAGPIKVAVLPRTASRAGKRDVVAVLSADDGVVWLIDDETGVRTSIGRDANGHPKVGGAPANLVVDPVVQGTTAHLYVASFQESFVVQIEVPVDDISTLQEPANGFRRILGGSQ
jgi:hypothetical protein